MSDKNLNPIILFQNWYEIASEKEINDPNAMCLSTVDKDNCPHSRMVLLKGFDENGFKFFTNYQSNKSCLLYTSPSPRDKRQSRMPSSA